MHDHHPEKGIANPCDVHCLEAMRGLSISANPIPRFLTELRGTSSLPTHSGKIKDLSIGEQFFWWFLVQIARGRHGGSAYGR